MVKMFGVEKEGLWMIGVNGAKYLSMNLFKQGFKMRTASPDAAAILRMRTAAQPHQTAIAV
ncbi:hypothetical protein A2U01_0039878 [Trifolium medium]|uniref:Uncharacterized protein n=1 Tax=Trifolium medium TaxID=97028 RepID=A0A392Q2U8_9FABA|nr:hypothetical protein [Trifolium medium]